MSLQAQLASSGTHLPTVTLDSLMVLVSVELAVPAGQSVTALTEEHKGFVLVDATIDCALTIWSLSRPCEGGIMPLTISNSRADITHIHFQLLLQPWPPLEKTYINNEALWSPR